MIPSVHNMALSMLKFLQDSKPHNQKELKLNLIKEHDISKEDQHKFTATNQNLIYNRMMWSVSYLRRAGLVENYEKGSYKILKQGLNVLEKDQSTITRKFMNELISKQTSDSDEKSTFDEDDKEIIPPEEIIEDLYIKSKNNIYDKLMSRIQDMDPYAFEKLVNQLLTKIYSGNPEVGKHNNKAHDDGIDGVINKDELGLEKIYVQAKRWKDTRVGAPEIRNFIGALQSKQTINGIFITASNFTKESQVIAEKNVNIILINGKRLKELLYENNIGVHELKSYIIKDVDDSYFDQIN